MGALIEPLQVALRLGFPHALELFRTIAFIAADAAIVLFRRELPTRVTLR